MVERVIESTLRSVGESNWPVLRRKSLRGWEKKKMAEAIYPISSSAEKFRMNPDTREKDRANRHIPQSGNSFGARWRNC